MTDISYKRSENKFISKTFLYMTMGLVTTFIVAYLVSISEVFMNLIYSNGYSLFAICAIEIGLVVIINKQLKNISTTTAFALFLLYSAVNGITFATIFAIYDLSSIITVFIIAAIMFFCCSMIGLTSKKDLSTMGRICIMALIGIIVASIMNFFIGSASLYNGINYIGLFLFCGLTAYDMQKIKVIHQSSYELNKAHLNKFAVIAALELYLDLINLFIYLLRLIGKRR
ncbi:MAG: Bax inhibitor-1/YccA family protein [Clostridium argentinense]|uniref:Bax inhibitor-1/YccA family protein n=1 Tax=Clostridium faecium TaxID=2762223 RepID=A0ABR8YTN9_9CLOT|nr:MULTISPECIES: Bax inhibitor-1/YccA family protein [Clostridium]MBD8047585.1 Bax inhibitor-1/YccA family protein [Clostridium faecium]MBS5822986.1 Bax inhibitor-1/YccA family protein [Clostridium argentinense]MDU1349776.1 Bax inhibitor-1/YccA family protein [Clostridium argentinense]